MRFSWFALLTGSRYMIPTMVVKQYFFRLLFFIMSNIHFKEFHFQCFVIASGQGITITIVVCASWQNDFQAKESSAPLWPNDGMEKMFKYICWWRLTAHDHFILYMEKCLFCFYPILSFSIQSPLNYSFDSFLILFNWSV